MLNNKYSVNAQNPIHQFSEINLWYHQLRENKIDIHSNQFHPLFIIAFAWSVVTIAFKYAHSNKSNVGPSEWLLTLFSEFLSVTSYLLDSLSQTAWDSEKLAKLDPSQKLEKLFFPWGNYNYWSIDHEQFCEKCEL